jgi:uncharacterized protein (TIGR00369 family)
MTFDEVRSLVAHAIGASPLARRLGLAVASIEPDRVRIRLPFDAGNTTLGDLVHGGAIAALVDVAATAVAWSTPDLPASPQGTTIGFTVNFVAAARGCDLTADARIVRRGRQITVCDVDVLDPSGTTVARALVTYKLAAR